MFNPKPTKYQAASIAVMEKELAKGREEAVAGHKLAREGLGLVWASYADGSGRTGRI